MLCKEALYALDKLLYLGIQTTEGVHHVGTSSRSVHEEQVAIILIIHFGTSVGFGKRGKKSAVKQLLIS